MSPHDLQRILLDTQDPAKRARAHLGLGEAALAEDDFEVAVRHLREALVLDNGLEQARELLAQLGEGSTVVVEPVEDGGRRVQLRSMVRRIIGREAPVEA